MILRTSLCTLALLCAQTALARDVSKITRVILYPGSATVERTAQISAGTQKLEIADLPANFDTQTLRIEADPGITLGAFIVKEVASTAAPNPRQAELEKQIEAIVDQIAQIDVERHSAELVTGYLAALGGSAESSKTSAAPHLGATLEAIRQGGQDAYSRIRKATIQKRELEKQRIALQSELEKVQSQHRASRSLSLNLASSRKGQVRISYQVDGPGWQPAYRATLDSTTATVKIERQALITQASGEDWQQVALRLSTSQPQQSPQGPQVHPWPLQIREPRILAKPAARSALNSAQAPAPALMAESASDAFLPEVQIEEGRFATEFEVATPVSLAADGRQITLHLEQHTLPVSLRAQAVPRQSTTAFLVASAELPQGVWLAGNIQLYRDGAYIGNTQWSAHDDRQLNLPFGRDDLIQISAHYPQIRNSESGLIEQRRERQMISEYRVHNRHQQAITLLLLEPSPISLDEKIRVEKRFDPAVSTENWEEKRGVIAWQGSIAAGATRLFKADYRISWPKDAEISGLR
jgi:uncharacterized protein (TIGR02231 family)